MNTRSRALGLGGLVAASLTALMWPLHAAPIDPPIPPLPPPPEQIQPVLEVVAPIASAECGNAVLVTVLVPVAAAVIPIPGGLPVNILPVFGPALVVCGAVPQPGTRLSCSPDQAAADALNQVTGAAAGTPVPIDTRVFGPAVQEAYVVQDNLPPPANTAGLADQVSGALTCAPLTAPTTPPVETSPPAEAAQPPAEVSGLELGDFVGGGSPVADFASPAEPTSPVAQIVEQSQRPTVPVVQVSGGGPGFAYPVILVLPLLLLALGGYLGWALTRPVVPAQR